MIKTKSLQSSKSVSDGLRICIMRRVKPDYDFDVWYPALSPSEKLLQDYVIDNQISWEEFKPLFIKEILKNKKHLANILHLSKKTNITLLCWEDEPDTCHRLIVLAVLKKMQPELDIRLG